MTASQHETSQTVRYRCPACQEVTPHRLKGQRRRVWALACTVCGQLSLVPVQPAGQQRAPTGQA